MAVESKNTNSPGIAISMMRAYRVASARMSGGVPSALSMGSVKVPPNTATSRPKATPTVSVVPATALTLPVSPAPQAWPISTEAPAPRPIVKAIKKNITGKKLDTAASAPTPSICPT
ncbi:hypothetical protein D9M73_170300 [compost metagenome]